MKTFLVLLTLLISCGPSIAETGKTASVAEGTASNKLIEIAPHLKRAYLRGSSFQMGQQWAKVQEDKIRSLQLTFKGMAMYFLRENEASIRAKALKIAKNMDKQDLDEIKSIALSCKIKYEDMLIYNLFYSLCVTKIGCRQFAVWGKRTTDGELLHARNLDWFDYPGSPMKKFNTVVNYKGKKQIEYISLSWPGFTGCLTGTNKAGITIGYNQLNFRGDLKHFSEPTFFTIKRALRTCKTVEEVIKLFKKALPMDSGSVLVSDATQKKAAVIEIIRGKVGVRQPKPNELNISNANHATKEAGIAPASASYNAKSPVCTVANRISQKFSPKNVKNLMGHSTVLQPDLNLMCVIFAPSGNRMWLSCGRKSAANGPFVELKLFSRDE
jgi:hypothetical protein